MGPRSLKLGRPSSSPPTYHCFNASTRVWLKSMYLLKRYSADKKLRRRQTGSGPKEICTLPYGMCVVGEGERGGGRVNVAFLVDKVKHAYPYRPLCFLTVERIVVFYFLKKKTSLVVKYRVARHFSCPRHKKKKKKKKKE